MNKVILVLSLLASCTLAGAAPVDCLTVLGSNTNTLVMGCSLGGLVFDQFSLTSAPLGSTIFLSALGTGVVSGGVNLGFQITTPMPPVDTIFQYRVSTVDGSFQIDGVDNYHNGSGDTRIGEIVCDQAFVGGICFGNVLANFANPPVTAGRFSAQSQVFILKDISEPSANSFISNFVNSHETPEPGTAMLIGAGLFGVAALARKRRTIQRSGDYCAEMRTSSDRFGPEVIDKYRGLRVHKHAA